MKKLVDDLLSVPQTHLASSQGGNNISTTEGYVKKLFVSKNIILRGAPGTGKTYLAKQIAASVITNGRTSKVEELLGDEQKRLGFVQFHPSYDYTDFVEGLRPNNLGENVGFKLVDGVFKEFVEIARRPNKNVVDNFDETWMHLV